MKNAFTGEFSIARNAARGEMNFPIRVSWNFNNYPLFSSAPTRSPTTNIKTFSQLSFPVVFFFCLPSFLLSCAMHNQFVVDDVYLILNFILYLGRLSFFPFLTSFLRVLIRLSCFLSSRLQFYTNPQKKEVENANRRRREENAHCEIWRM